MTRLLTLTLALYISAATLAPQAQAVNHILNAKNRLNRSLNVATKPLRKAARRKLCKKSQLKTKSCYIRTIATKNNFAIVTVDKKGKGYYGVFKFFNKKWHLKTKGKVSKMTVARIMNKKPRLIKSTIQDLVTQIKIKEGGAR